MAPDLVGNRSNRSEHWAGSIFESLVGLVPVEVPLEERVIGRVQFGSPLSLGDRGTILTTSDLDVEGLGPELTVADGAVVVDGDDLGSEDEVAVGEIGRDGDSLGVGVVVEDGVSAPVAGLFLGRAGRVAALAVVDQGRLVDLEELERCLVDLGAVAIAVGHVGGGPAVVRAVPSLLVGTTGTIVMPVELDVGAGGNLDSVGRGRSILVGNDVGATVIVSIRPACKAWQDLLVDLVTVDGLVSPALVGPPSRRLVTGILLRSLAETLVGLASSLELLNGCVTGHGGDERRNKGAGLDDLGHGHGDDGNGRKKKNKLHTKGQDGIERANE